MFAIAIFGFMVIHTGYILALPLSTLENLEYKGIPKNPKDGNKLILGGVLLDSKTAESQKQQEVFKTWNESRIAQQKMNPGNEELQSGNIAKRLFVFPLKKQSVQKPDSESKSSKPSSREPKITRNSAPLSAQTIRCIFNYVRKNNIQDGATIHACNETVKIGRPHTRILRLSPARARAESLVLKWWMPSFSALTG